MQTALEKSGAVRKFRAMQVHVLRRHTQESMSMVRMAADYDPVSRHVAIHMDYTLHPGDMVLVEQDASTMVERVLKNTLGALGTGL